jgi:mRNA interferase MazF
MPITRPMTGFSRGTVVKVPFPYTDRATRQYRPALTVSSPQTADIHGLLWVLMITSAGNKGWPGDVRIKSIRSAGLPAPSVIRTAKIATIDAADAMKLGSISPSELQLVMSRLRQELGFARAG